MCPMTQHIRNNTAGSTTWKTFLQAYTDVHDHRRAQGMLVSDIRFNSSSTFSEADSHAAFGEENFVETLGLGKSLKMPCRGYFYCTNNRSSWKERPSARVIADFLMGELRKISGKETPDLRVTSSSW